MTEAERALLLTVARLFRAHLREHPMVDAFVTEDVIAIQDALAPFESNIVALQPNEDKTEN
jgi:hypothetical protein